MKNQCPLLEKVHLVRNNRKKNKTMIYCRVGTAKWWDWQEFKSLPDEISCFFFIPNFPAAYSHINHVHPTGITTFPWIYSWTNNRANRIIPGAHPPKEPNCHGAAATSDANATDTFVAAQRKADIHPYSNDLQGLRPKGTRRWWLLAVVVRRRRRFRPLLGRRKPNYLQFNQQTFTCLVLSSILCLFWIILALMHSHTWLLSEPNEASYLHFVLCLYIVISFFPRIFIKISHDPRAVHHLGLERTLLRVCVL